MPPTLDDLYIEWLYDHVGLPKRGRNRSYWKLFHFLHSKEFVWLILKDESRAEDGKALRWMFVEESGFRVAARWMYEPCTVLEMMVGVARRLSVLTDGEPRGWFTQLLYNMQLDHKTDLSFDRYISEVDAQIDRLIWRRYDSNGKGGLFPLTYPAVNQRETEIWNQLNAWLIEKQREEG